jgi:inorganic pyrophosphatase
VITMLDDGRNDEKIIAIPFGDPTYNHYTEITQLPEHIAEEMNHFFRVYKQLEQKDTVVNEVGGRERAVEIIKAAIDSYVEQFCK